MASQISHANLSFISKFQLSRAERRILDASLRSFNHSKEIFIKVDRSWNKLINSLTPADARIDVDMIEDDSESLNAWLNGTRTIVGRVDEACRRIFKVAENKEKILDLSKLDLCDLPSEVGLLTHLTDLVLDENHLNSLPTSIGLLKNLKTFSLGENYESLIIPNQFWRLTQLTKLNLSCNFLTSLPTEIGLMTQLTELVLYCNQLTSLPNELWRLTQLTEFCISNNPITSVPTEIGLLTKLNRLMFFNNLTSLPAEIWGLTELTTLWLFGNQFTSLSSEIGRLKKLTLLDLSECKLTSLPTEIWGLSELGDLDLRQNELTALPTAIGQLTQLTELNLRANQLASLPAEIGLLTKITVLDLSKNQLTSLPAEIWRLTQLTKLCLGGNQLTFLPTEIGLLTELTVLDLSENKLTSLPTEIWRLTQLTKLCLGSNQLTFLPTEIGALALLTHLTFSKNQNLCHLPFTLGEIPGLTHIDIDETAIPAFQREAILRQCREMRNRESLDVLPSRLVKWLVYGQSCIELNLYSLTVNQKHTLNEWLLRLERTKDFAANPSLLAKTVCPILDDIQNPDFKDLFFNQAEANNECCGDRSAMALNEIYTSWLILCKGSNQAVLPAIARTLRLRKTIDALIRKNKREELESVEIFLFYETELRNVLKLETAIYGMFYGTIGQREWIDQEALIQDVRENYYEELINIPIFEKLMEKQWKRVNEEFQEKLASLGDCPPGCDEDPAVLNYQARQGEIMVEWKNRKIEAAKVYVVNLAK